MTRMLVRNLKYVDCTEWIVLEHVTAIDVNVGVVELSNGRSIQVPDSDAQRVAQVFRVIE